MTGAGHGGAPRILVIDNYDSFTYNLVHAVAKAGGVPEAARNDAITRDEIAAHRRAGHGPEGIILSPGPGHPENRRDFGVCTDLITDPIEAPAPIPMLGVCLGMQGMAQWTGGRVVRAPDVVHGMASPVLLQPHPLFAGIEEAVQVGRYHSLCVDRPTLHKEWDDLGASADGVLMAMAHRHLPWMGVQFHPESILTPQGQRMVENFVTMCGQGGSVGDPTPAGDAEDTHA